MILRLKYIFSDNVSINPPAEIGNNIIKNDFQTL